jgi:sugar phosphate isomerase/epimerase
MPNISRRAVLRQVLRGALAAPAARLALTSQASAAQEHSLKTIGVQLYTVRDVLPKKPLEVLKEIDNIGYREVEVVYPATPIWSSLQQTRLQAVSMHVTMNLFQLEKAAELRGLIADAKQRGFKFLVYPYVMPNDRTGLDGMRKLAVLLNAAGQQCHEAGLRLSYHNHAFEFQPLDGTTPLAVLMQETKPEHLGLEMDVFWVTTGGHDPVQLLQQYSGRVPLIHLKDRQRDGKVQYNEDVPAATFKELGHGSLDMPAILKAAAAAGVEHYFVEQDQTPGDPLASLRQSFDYLSHLKF